MKKNERRRAPSGQGMIEYVLIVGLLSVFVISIMMAIGPAIEDMLSDSVSGEMVNNASVALSAKFYANSGPINPLTGLPF